VATVLALDIGSSSVRAQRFDERAEPIDELRRAEYGGSEPDGLARLVRDVLGGHRPDAVSSFGHSLIALDPRGRPLTPILGWRDLRSAPQAMRLRDRLDAAGVAARTGQPLHPSYWPAKLAWLAETEPGVFRGAARFVSFADYVLGEPVTSPSIASGTGLLDLAARSWDEELLDCLGIEPTRLPALGDVPVFIDGVCANLGSGCTGGRAALSVGTSGALRILYRTETPRPRPGLFCYLVDGDRVVEGGALSDGGNLWAWLNEVLGPDGGGPAQPEHGVTFLPLLGGERSTGWDPDARGAIAGLSFATTAADIRQAALEGVAFRFAAVADLLPEIEDVVASGAGLVADAGWIQIMADALDRPVTASAVAEASLRGAAVAILQRTGYEPLPARLGTMFEPQKARAEAYRSARERQQRLYEELNGQD
jgi:gluconokinase